MVKQSTKNENNVLAALAAVRVMLGFVFLWAFFDKTFGLGFSTAPEAAWVSGGSPTTGFLTGVSNGGGPFADFFGGFVGLVWVDWLFMVGLLAVGFGLLFGVAMKLSAAAGITLLVLMWLAVLPLENNPVIDDHLVYAGVLLALVFAEPRWSIHDWWVKQDVVKNYKWLR